MEKETSHRSISIDNVLWHIKDLEGERRLQSEFGVIQSRMLLPSSDILVSHYQQHMMLAFLLHPDARSILHLGLGGGCMIRFIHNYWPDSIQNVIEKYDEFVSIAQDYFYLPKSDRINIRVEDAIVLERQKPKCSYDLIFLDLYNEHGPVNYFFRSEFLSIIKNLLNPGGWIIGNTWNKDIKKWRKIFPQVLLAKGFGDNEILFGTNNKEERNRKRLREKAKLLKLKVPLDFVS